MEAIAALALAANEYAVCLNRINIGPIRGERQNGSQACL